MNHYDVIIIGTGAGGGTLAYKLAPTGKRILLIERGDYVRREKENWSTKDVVALGRYNTREEWRDNKGKPLHPHTNYYVGGNTKFYGSALFRLRERDFGELRHHGGVSPAWPVRYSDMEPYYTEAERIYHVHGERGGDPTEPWASTPYPHPAVSHEPRIQQLHEDLERLGHHPFHVPLGIMLDESDPHKSKCIRCNTCDGFPCLLHAKSDAHVCCVDPALEHPNVSIMTNTLVTKLVTSDSGREVRAVHVLRDGEPMMLSADVVVASCGAINSAALLLRSANNRHPRGLANSSDMVGRHYMGHNNSILFAISRHVNDTVFQKTLALNDFYFCGQDFPYPMGHISFVGKFDAHMLSAGAPKLTPELTLDVMARHSLDFWMTSEDLPDPDNRVQIDRDGKIMLSYTPNNLEGHNRLVAKLKELIRHSGCEEHIIPLNAFVGDRMPLAAVAHQNGTLRFGQDPKSSVLDVNCRTHDIDNLYVVDGSFFPSSAAVNPALTIMANALRVGDHLTERLA
jgi:choline dehydrogenase-like flavoprotein